MKALLILLLALPVMADSFYGPTGSNVGRAERSGNTTRQSVNDIKRFL